MSLVSRMLTRVGVVLLISLFAAVMCAGPGAIILPFTETLAQPLICPAGSTLQRTERQGTDSEGDRVTYINLYCVDREGAQQAANLRSFLVLALIYFVLFFFPLLVIVAIMATRPGGLAARPAGPPARPLSAEGVREVQALMAQNRKLEAIKLVRALTGANLISAKNHVEALSALPPNADPNAPAPPRSMPGMPAAPPLSYTAGVEELKRLKAQLDSGEITRREYETRAAEIAMRLSIG